MLEFTKTLKLYYFRENNLVSLSILCSPFQVQTFYIPGDRFDKMIKDAPNGGAQVDNYFVQRKKHYFRFSHHASGMQTNLRFENAKWDALIAQYLEQKAVSPDGTITCIVD